MAAWSVDFLVSEPPTDRLAAPTYPAWELMGSLARRGHRVRGLYPASHGTAARAPAGVEPFALPPALALGRTGRRGGRPGARAGWTEGADVVVRWPLGFGAVALGPGARGNRTVVAGFVENVELAAFDRRHATRTDASVRNRLDAWLDRRSVRRREEEAVRQASLLLVDSEETRKALGECYGVPATRVAFLPPGVPEPPEHRSSAARAELRIPLDVPVAAFASALENPLEDGWPVALEAFRRVRSFFPGARLLAAGVPPSRPDPGVVFIDALDLPALSTVLAASDVFLYPGRTSRFPVIPALAMRFGLPTIVREGVTLARAAPKTGIRVVGGDDAGEYASVLAELLADPATQHAVGRSGKAYADTLRFDRVGERFEELVGPLVSG